MNPKVPNLVSYIISYINERDSYVTKTKLLKLLYLLDVEYYRKFRETFTGFNWVYFHLGPWTDKYDELLDTLKAQASLFITLGSKGNEFLSTNERVELRQLFGTFKEERPLLKVLRNWAEEPTNTILDYVYFRTEPMQQGERYESLDFSLVRPDSVPSFSLESSGKSPEQIQLIKDKIKERFKTIKEVASLTVDVKDKPRFDDVFFDAMEELEKQDH
jgi:Protein of unknown function (DUF4065)